MRLAPFLLLVAACGGAEAPAPTQEITPVPVKFGLPMVPGGPGPDGNVVGTIMVSADGMGLDRPCELSLAECLPSPGVVHIAVDKDASARQLAAALVAVGRAQHAEAWVRVSGPPEGLLSVPPLPMPVAGGGPGLLSVVVEGDRVLLLAMGGPPSMAPKATVSLERYAQILDEWKPATMTTVYVRGGSTVEQALLALVEARQSAVLADASLGIDWMHRPAKELSDEAEVEGVRAALRANPEPMIPAN